MRCNLSFRRSSQAPFPRSQDRPLAPVPHMQKCQRRHRVQLRRKLFREPGPKCNVGKGGPHTTPSKSQNPAVCPRVEVNSDTLYPDTTSDPPAGAGGSGPKDAANTRTRRSEGAAESTPWAPGPAAHRRAPPATSSLAPLRLPERLSEVGGTLTFSSKGYPEE